MLPKPEMIFNPRSEKLIHIGLRNDEGQYLEDYAVTSGYEVLRWSHMYYVDPGTWTHAGIHIGDRWFWFKLPVAQTFVSTGTFTVSQSISKDIYILLESVIIEQDEYNEYTELIEEVENN